MLPLRLLAVKISTNGLHSAECKFFLVMIQTIYFEKKSPDFGLGIFLCLVLEIKRSTFNNLNHFDETSISFPQKAMP